MNILIVHTHYQQPGGEDQVVAEEIALLRSRGHEVSTFFRHNDALRDTPKLQAARLAIWNRTAARELTEQIKRIEPDVVHFHNTFPFMSPAVLRAAKRTGAAVVQTLHNFRMLCVNGLLYRAGSPCEKCIGSAIPMQGVINRCYRGSRGASGAVAAMIAVHRALGTWRRDVDAFIALSPFAREKFIAGQLPAERLHVKPNFLVNDPGCGDGAGGYMLYVGRLSHEKGVGTLTDAWAGQSKRLPLHVVGDGPMSSSIEALAQRHSDVRWFGRLDFDAVMQQIRGARAVIVPSTCYENFPRTIVEAFAAGTPVITAAHGSMKDIVSDGDTGLHFAAGSADALATVIDRCAKDESLLPGMRAAARATYEQHYTADRNHQQLIAIYEAALAHANVSASAQPAVV